MSSPSTGPTVQADGADRAAAAGCRSCGADRLVLVLDVRLQPPAERLRTEAVLDADEPSFPLDVAACPERSLVS